jgi:hypothetical protein
VPVPVSVGMKKGAVDESPALALALTLTTDTDTDTSLN